MITKFQEIESRSQFRMETISRRGTNGDEVETNTVRGAVYPSTLKKFNFQSTQTITFLFDIFICLFVYWPLILYRQRNGKWKQSRTKYEVIFCFWKKYKPIIQQKDLDCHYNHRRRRHRKDW